MRRRTGRLRTAAAAALFVLGATVLAPLSWQNRPTYQQVVEFPAHR